MRKLSGLTVGGVQQVTGKKMLLLKYESPAEVDVGLKGKMQEKGSSWRSRLLWRTLTDEGKWPKRGAVADENDSETELPVATVADLVAMVSTYL